MQINKNADQRFWQSADSLINKCKIVIDRPAGSVHPHYSSIVYPLDYGYLSDTSSPDGNEIDIWVGSIPDKKLTAIICTLDMAKRDSEIKMLIGCTPEEIQTIAAFHDTGDQKRLLQIRQSI